MTQNEAILSMMKHGWVGPLDAARMGCLRFSGRVLDIKREGVLLEDRWAEGNGKKWKEFRVVRNDYKQQELL